MSVAVLFPVFGSGTPLEGVTVAVSTIEPVADGLTVLEADAQAHAVGPAEQAIAKIQIAR